MEFKKTVVILYGKEKHELLAGGIKQYIMSHSDVYDVVMIDDETITPNYSALSKRKFYTFCQRNANWLYSLYSRHDEKKYLKQFTKQRKSIEIKRSSKKHEKLLLRISYVKNIIFRFNPTVVICMTPNSLKLALNVKELYHFDIDVFSFMADFGLDLRFLDSRCDKYLVANEDVRKRIMRYGIGEDHIVVTGVPSNEGKNPIDKAKCRKELGIDNEEPLVVLSGGKYGAFRVIDDYNKLVASDFQFNLIALTGGNSKLSALMKAFNLGDNNKFIQVMDNYDHKKLLTAADIFITIPSTDNILNGLIYGCVTIAIKPVSMIEKRNFKYLNNTGVAVASKSAHATAHAVAESLVEDKVKQKQLKIIEDYINSKEKFKDNIYKLLEEKNDKTHSNVQTKSLK